MCDREIASLKFHFFNKHGRGLKGIKWILKSPYFIQDNFKTPFNRLIGCRIKKHRRVSDEFCFNCYRQIKGNKNESIS